MKARQGQAWQGMARRQGLLKAVHFQSCRQTRPSPALSPNEIPLNALTSAEVKSQDTEERVLCGDVTGESHE